jgi:gluconate 2-dehydrogenase gamma chain
LNSRRSFLQTSFLSTVLLISSSQTLFGATTPMQTINLVQKDLFAFADKSGVNVVGYMHLILKHSRVSKEDKEFIINGVKWLNEESVEVYKKIYTRLTQSQRQKLLKRIAKTSWGESWIDTILTYIMEAMMSDPIYGVNKNEVGQKWVNHIEGYPRPKEPLL